MSPQAFEACQKAGGKVRRKSLSDGRYINICYKDGKSYAGEVHYKSGERLKNAILGKAD